MAGGDNLSPPRKSVLSLGGRCQPRSNSRGARFGADVCLVDLANPYNATWAADVAFGAAMETSDPATPREAVHDQERKGVASRAKMVVTHRLPLGSSGTNHIVLEDAQLAGGACTVELGRIAAFTSPNHYKVFVTPNPVPRAITWSASQDRLLGSSPRARSTTPSFHSLRSGINPLAGVPATGTAARTARERTVDRILERTLDEGGHRLYGASDQRRGNVPGYDGVEFSAQGRPLSWCHFV